MIGSTEMVPELAIGAGHLRYRGPVDQCARHGHAALQVVVAPTGQAAVEDASGRVHRGRVLVVSPMVRHRVLPCADVLTCFVEPQSALADRWRHRVGVVDESDTITGAALDELLDAGRPSASLDARLVAAMTVLRTDRTLPIRDLARQVGLSPPRLRALAHQQLGMPLTRWRAWVRLARAAELAAAGLSLSEAAVGAGFTDQAHLTRWTRDTIGMSPGALLPTVRGQDRRAV